MVRKVILSHINGIFGNFRAVYAKPPCRTDCGYTVVKIPQCGYQTENKCQKYGSDHPPASQIPITEMSYHTYD